MRVDVGATLVMAGSGPLPPVPEPGGTSRWQCGVVCRRVYESRCLARLEELGVEVVGAGVPASSKEDVVVRAVSEAPRDLCEQLSKDPLAAWVWNPLVLDRRAASWVEMEAPTESEIEASTLGGAARVRVTSTSARACIEMATPNVGRFAFSKQEYEALLAGVGLEDGSVAYGWAPPRSFGGHGLAAGQPLCARLRRPGAVPTTNPASRAYYKLDEALWRFGTNAPSGKALDLGAAPGGWTQRLAESCDTVVAVDPGELAPDVAALPNVRHVRSNFFALDFSDEDEPFDVVVTDMCLHDSSRAVEAVLSLAPVIRPGALIVVAIKINGRGRSAEGRDELAATPAANLMRHLEPNALLTHLFTATRRERTVVGHWRGLSSSLGAPSPDASS